MSFFDYIQYIIGIKKDIKPKDIIETPHAGELTKIIASVADDCETFGITSFVEWKARQCEMILSQYQCPTCGTRG